MEYLILGVIFYIISKYIFKKCKQCKKYVLARKINKNGLCQLCEQDRIEKENKKIEEAKRAEQERQQRLEKQRIERENRINEFKQILSSLKPARIDLATEKVKADSEREPFEIKYSNITSKTNTQNIKDFIVIDTETTGLNCRIHKIIEITAIKFIDFIPVEIFTTRINPKKPIPPEATAVNNIRDEDVKDAPYFWQIIPSLNEFIGKLPIVGHNLPFDMKFLLHEGLSLNLIKRKYFDTLSLAQSCLKTPKRKWDRELESYKIDYFSDYDVENYKLTTLCEYFKIGIDNAHSSASDCLATGYLFKHLIYCKGAAIESEVLV